MNNLGKESVIASEKKRHHNQGMKNKQTKQQKATTTNQNTKHTTQANNRSPPSKKNPRKKKETNCNCIFFSDTAASDYQETTRGLWPLVTIQRFKLCIYEAFLLAEKHFCLLNEYTSSSTTQLCTYMRMVENIIKGKICLCAVIQRLNSNAKISNQTQDSEISYVHLNV